MVFCDILCLDFTVRPSSPSRVWGFPFSSVKVKSAMPGLVDPSTPLHSSSRLGGVQTVQVSHHSVFIPPNTLRSERGTPFNTNYVGTGYLPTIPPVIQMAKN